MSIRTGDRVVGFELPEGPGQVVNVGEEIGARKIVLLFFPFAFSSVCTEAMCTFRDDWNEWSALDASVYGISIDSPFVAARFREEERIPFSILSDFNKDVIRTFGVVHEDLKGLKGVSKRAVFVIGSDGIVAYDWVTDNPGDQIDFTAIRKAVESAP